MAKCRTCDGNGILCSCKNPSRRWCDKLVCRGRTCPDCKGESEPAIIDIVGSVRIIERLELATGPDRELDGVIKLAHAAFLIADGKSAAETKTACGGDLYDDPRPYTKSIEAALALMPAWASFELTKSASGPPAFTRARLWDWRRSPTMSDPGNEWKSEGSRPLEINICIAALKMLGL